MYNCCGAGPEPGAEEGARREACAGGFPGARALAGRRRGAAGIAERWADVGPYAVAAAILRHRRRYALVAKEFHVTAGDVQTYLYSFLKPEFPDLFDELKWALHQRRTRVRRRDGPANVKVGAREPVPYEEAARGPMILLGAEGDGRVEDDRADDRLGRPGWFRHLRMALAVALAL